MPTTQQPEATLKYLQLEEQLRRQIESGALRPGDRLPSHAELHARYSMTRPTVERAHALLEQKGLITRIHRRGIFVADRSSSAVSMPPGVTVDSGTIVAIGVPDRSIFERAMSLLLPQANAAGFSLVCRLIDRDASSGTLSSLETEKPSGYILFGRHFLPLAKQLHEMGQRVVLVGTPYANTLPNVPVVQSDQEQGGYRATRHLLDLRHRGIAFRGWSDWPQMQRYQGHQRALAEARRKGIAVQESFIFEEEYQKWREMPEIVEAYFRRPDAPTGIIVWNDQMAVALLSLLSYVGVRVPQEVSIVGYDNLPEGEQVHPPLTTVDVGIHQQLQAALSLITSGVAPSSATRVIVLPTLIGRESSAIAPTSVV